MLCSVEPVDHAYVNAVSLVSVTLPPSQNVVGPPAFMFAVGVVITSMMIAVAVAEHPPALVMVTS